MSTAVAPQTAKPDFDAMIKAKLEEKTRNVKTEVYTDFLNSCFVDLSNDPKATLDHFLTLIENLDPEVSSVANGISLRAFASVILADMLKRIPEASSARTRAPRGSLGKAAEELTPKVLAYLAANPGQTVGQIAKGLNLGDNDAFALKKSLGSLINCDSPKVKGEGEKRAKRYTLVTPA